MSADIINLRQARKSKARNEKEKRADQNRVTHGLSKAEKNLSKALNEQAGKRLDQGRLEKPKGTTDEAPSMSECELQSNPKDMGQFADSVYKAIESRCEVTAPAPKVQS